MVIAQLKRLHSPDVYDLASFAPPDPERFSFLLQIMAGPAGEDAVESFDVVVCTPKWLDEKLGSSDLIVGRHHLIVRRYNYERLHKFVADSCLQCRGNTWAQVAGQLGRIGKWEFEDFQEY